MIFTILLISYMLFGLVFYDLPYFQMVDEIFPFLIFAFSLISKGKMCKPLIPFFVFIVFYIAYSFLIGSNVPIAILFDSVCFSKSILTLFAVLIINPKLNAKEQQIIRIIILCLIPVLIYAGINVRMSGETVSGQLLSGARFSFCCVYLGLTYYLFSKHKQTDILVMAFLIALGFMFPTSKFFALMLVVCGVFFLTKQKKIKFGFKSVILGTIAVGAIVLFSIDDILLYFSEDVARGAMYLTAGKILLDYFPFGSGLASFSTPSSATYYSNTYYEYSLDKIHGLTPSKPDFVSDAFLPSMAEFGIVGLILFILFIAYLFKRVHNCKDLSDYRIGVVILADIIIESISDVSIIGNRGVFAMILLGYVLSSKRLDAVNTLKVAANENIVDK